MGVERYLLREERHVTTARQHVAVLIRPALELATALTVFLLLPARGPLGSLGSLVVLALLGDALLRVGRWRMHVFVITDQRVLLITGLVARRVSMLPLRKVTDMTYRRSLPGRILGYGEFIMESAGEAVALRRVRFLPSPDTLYLEVSQLLFSRGSSIAPADAEM